MTDIVNRLRNIDMELTQGDFYAVIYDAAEEIEILRSELKRVYAERDMWEQQFRSVS